MKAILKASAVCIMFLFTACGRVTSDSTNVTTSTTTNENITSVSTNENIDANTTVITEKEDIKINNDNFPDYNFRTYVSERLDKDKNGILDAKECEINSMMIIDHVV